MKVNARIVFLTAPLKTFLYLLLIIYYSWSNHNFNSTAPYNTCYTAIVCNPWTVSPATVQITLSSVNLHLSVSEVDCFHDNGMKFCKSFNVSVLPYSVLYFIKYKLSCLFYTFWSYFLFLLLTFRYILGTKQVLDPENGFQCSWYFYWSQFIMNMATTPTVQYWWHN